MASKSSDYLSSKRAAALGGRLRRLSEMIDAQAKAVYVEHGIAFEQKWFGVLNQIALHDAVSVTDIAAALGITHVSVSQSRSSLEKAGLIESRKDKTDQRRFILKLTRKGKRLVDKLSPLWHALELAAQEIDREAGGALDALDRLEEALNAKSLVDRIDPHLP